MKLKNLYRFRAPLATLISLALIIVTFNFSNTYVSAASKPAFAKKTATITVGDTLKLKVKNAVKKSTYSWTSSDKNIVDVSDTGVIKGIAAGNVSILCNITTPKETYNLICIVTVKPGKGTSDADNAAKNTQVGTVEKLDYTTNTYDASNKELKKYLNVYLPYGYDANDTKTKYNVLYLMHGGGENQDTIFGGHISLLKQIVDNMIYTKKIAPLIIVTPTFNNPGNGDMTGLVKNFHNELIKDIIPTVESKYHTYAASTSKEDLVASRSHRAFGGFSMGSACTWYSFIYGLDYFEYYLPLSGDCWALGTSAGLNQPDKTAEYLANIAKESGYKPDQYDIFCATGSSDIAYNALKTQVEAMKKIPDQFIYSDDMSQGNLHFNVTKDAVHAWSFVNHYVEAILPYLFTK